MGYRQICVAAALQRYLDITPIAARLRDLAGLIATADGASVSVLTVEAPVELLPDVETTDEKLDRLAAPLRERGLAVTTELRYGRPSREIAAFVEESGADLLIIGTHSKRSPIDVGLGSTASAMPRDLAATLIMIRPTPEERDRAQELMIPRYPLVFPYG